MDERCRERFLLWADTPQFRQKLYQARERLFYALNSESRIYLAYSGGKDSTALLHLMLAQNIQRRVINISHGHNLVPPVVQEEIEAIARNMGAQQLQVRERPHELIEGEDGKTQWVSKDGSQAWFFRSISGHAAKLGAAITGIRAEESGKRARRGWQFSTCGQNVYAPLHEWSARDVWAYIAANDVPYLSFYDRMARFYEYEEIRFSTLFHDPRAFYGDNTGVINFAYADCKMGYIKPRD